mmetsp:Transcript_51832/g.155565  ORF Transcript_51832/g.155565 Transcript_51832/m.155565 type:complete len:661 (+) Transcript_51832:433-2415(+)
MNLCHGVLDRLDRNLEILDVDVGFLARRNDVLIEHVDETERLEFDRAGVVIVKNHLSRLALLLGEYSHLLEQFNVLLASEGVNGLDSRVDAPDSAVGQFFLRLFAVIVPVEDDAPVLVEGLLGDIVGGFSGVDPVGEFLELLRDNGIEDGVDHGHVLGGPDGAELEPGSSVGEGTGAVAILGGDLEGENLAGAEVERLDARDVFALPLAVLEVLEIEGHVVAEVHGNNGGGRLARSESEVVSGGGDGHAHEVAVLVDGSGDGGHDDGEGVVVPGGLVDILGIEELNAVGGGEGPVVVLAGSVDVVEGFLLEEGGEAVTRGDLLNDLHDHQVLIDLGGVVSVERSELELSGGDLPVTRLEGDAHLPRLVLNLLHASEGRGGAGEGGHVVIAHLLTAGGILANDGPAGHLKVGPLVVGLAGDEEDLLLESNVGADSLAPLARHVESEVMEETCRLLVHGRVGAEEGRLLVEGGAIVGDKGRGDEDGISAEEDGGGGIDGEVSASAVGATEAAVGVGGAIGLSLDEGLALEVVDGLEVRVELHHHVLDLTGQAVTDARGGHGLEPVAVHIGAIVGGPVEHGRCDGIGMLLHPGRIVENVPGRPLLLQVFVGDLSGEDVLPEIVVLIDRGESSNGGRGGGGGSSAGGDDRAGELTCGGGRDEHG